MLRRKLLALVGAGMLSYSTPLIAQTAPGSLPVVSETTIPTTSAPAEEITQPAVVNTLTQDQTQTTTEIEQPVDTADTQQAECIAKAMYFESRGEPLKGQKAVGYVILNRAHSKRFASTPCQVIAQRDQFSWYHNHKSIPTNVKSKFVALAKTIIDTYNKDNDPSNGALFFHAAYVSPGWRGVTRLERIGGHVFYR